jgi:hypothetical protein
MLSKVRDMVNLALARPPLRIHIISGEIPGNVALTLADGESRSGTLIRSSGQPTRIM